MVSGEGEAVGALGGEHPLEVIAGGEGGFLGLVLEVPHERGWVQEADCGYAERVGMGLGGHSLG